MEKTEEIMRKLWPELRGLATVNKDNVITIVEQFIEAAKAERDAELRELMPVEHKEDYPVLNQIDDAYVRGFNKCLSQVKALLSPNKEENGQRE